MTSTRRQKYCILFFKLNECSRIVTLPLTVAVALTGRVGQDHLHAAIGGVVRPLALLAEHVADAVGVRLVKLRRGRRGHEVRVERRPLSHTSRKPLTACPPAISSPKKYWRH